MLTTILWILWNLLHSTLVKYLACQAWMHAWCTIFGEYLSAIWIPEFEAEQRQSCSNTHICCSLFVIYCSVFSCLGCFRHLFGQQEKKRDQLAWITNHMQWITASRQSKGAPQEGWNVFTKTLPLSPNITEISVCQCYTNKKSYVPLLSYPPQYNDFINSLVQ